MINARGCATWGGGSLMSPRVLAAYAAGAGSFVLMEELEQAASRYIAEVTGAEGGYVTSGAAAAIVLGTAACIAGLDVERMERLPAPGDWPNRVLMPLSHRNGYEWSLQAAGARLAFFDDEGGVAALLAEADSDTVALFFAADREREQLALTAATRAAHSLGLLVLVDAALALPPVENLRRLVASGADLVVFSGGKSIRGPQSSGFIAGRSDLLLSVALQHQDMDVRQETWGRQDLLASHRVTRPPHNGIGRSMKVGKEEVVALLAALEEYLTRDHRAEHLRWVSMAHVLAERLDAIPGLAASTRDQDPAGRPIPGVELVVSPSEFGRTADDLCMTLLRRDPGIMVDDTAGAENRLRLDVENLQDAGVDDLVMAIIEARNRSGTGRSSVAP